MFLPLPASPLIPVPPRALDGVLRPLGDPASWGSPSLILKGSVTASQENLWPGSLDCLSLLRGGAGMSSFEGAQVGFQPEFL